MDNYEEFKKAFLNLSKIDLNSYKENQMKRRINSFISKNHCIGYDDFFRKIQSDRSLYEMFISFLTINVSEFYRNPAQWNTLEQKVIPHLKETFTGQIRIWSAACSTGDEPYSLAMVFSDYFPLDRIQIIATDLDHEVLSFAKKGIYNEKSLKGLPERYKSKFFERDSNGIYKVSDSLKKCITFKEHNLLRDAYPCDMNLVVCRNVLIYFTEEAKDEIYKGISKSLKKDGILFVGSTEQIIGSNKYDLDSFQSFFYKRI